MDEKGKRKRIEVTDEQIFDSIVNADSTPEPDLPNDDGKDATTIDVDGPLEMPVESDDKNEVDTKLDTMSDEESFPYETPSDDMTSEGTLDTSEIVSTNPESSEAPIVETEVEPETIATTLVEQEPATIADRPNAFQAPSELSSESPIAAAPVHGLAALKTGNKKRLMIIAASIGLFLILAILTWWLLSNKETPPAPVEQTDTTVAAPVEQPKLGIAATITEGTVEYMDGEAEWQAVTDDTELSEGDSVRTGKNSRAVLTLDDGSAIRLDANTTIKLTSLTANQIQVEHLDGIAYSRVVPSTDRTFTVTAGDATYQALGTAFTTIKNETDNGVQVFQSSVQVNGSADAVVEGKQFFQENKDDTLEGVVGDIDIDALVKNSFINWNISLDEKDNNFKDKLGVLPKIEERARAIKLEAEAAAKLKAEQEAAKKAAEEKAESEREAAARTTAGVMTLGVGDNNLLEWNYLGKPTNGYKLVYSKENTSPVFKVDSSQYISSSDQTSARLSSKLKGKYYVRVCAYKKESTCIDYSNVVIINL